MTKRALREEYKQKRINISSKDKLKWDDLMLLQFQQLYFNGIQTLLTYWPMANNNEPNTHLFSGYLRHTIPNLQMAYPVANFATNQMDAILIDEETIYKTNTYGITQPKEGITIPPQQIDLIFVPLLICDAQGYRVGYGKGFYDRFLSLCSETVVKIGFSYFAPIDNIDDAHEFDIPLNFCITPQKIYEF
jgi:5-formyltetrahydrofolate cyclo-ligase